MRPRRPRAPSRVHSKSGADGRAQPTQGRLFGTPSHRPRVAGRAPPPAFGGPLDAQFVTSHFLLLSRYKVTTTRDPGATTDPTHDTQVGATSGGAAPARPLPARRGVAHTWGPGCGWGPRASEGSEVRGGAGASPRRPTRPQSSAAKAHGTEVGGGKASGRAGRARRADTSRTVRPKFTRGPACTDPRGAHERAEGAHPAVTSPGSRYLSAAEWRRPRPAPRSN